MSIACPQNMRIPNENALCQLCSNACLYAPACAGRSRTERAHVFLWSHRSTSRLVCLVVYMS